MERFIGSFKHHQKFAKSAGRDGHPRSHSHPHHYQANIPAIQITQMTIDEGTDDELDSTQKCHQIGKQNDPNQRNLAKEKMAREGGREEQKGTTGVGTVPMPMPSAAPTTAATKCPMPELKGTTESGGGGNVMQSKEKATKNCHAAADNNALLSANKYQDRTAVNRQSTGTLNRLMLVAQALENEVDWRRRNDVNSSRIVFTLRMANIVLLLLVNLLLFSGVGQYHDRNGMRISLFLTMDKWVYQPSFLVDEVPPTFSEMRLTGQYCAAVLAVAMLFSTIFLQCVHCFRIRHTKMWCIFYAFACVPIALFIFGLEMHYSACPWLDDFYQSQLLRRNFDSMEKYFDTQCGINGWALAGIFSLLSCGFFVSDGLISAFFRADDSHGNESEKPEAIL